MTAWSPNKLCAFIFWSQVRSQSIMGARSNAFWLFCPILCVQKPAERHEHGKNLSMLAVSYSPKELLA